jgi:hypothetical protein
MLPIIALSYLVTECTFSGSSLQKYLELVAEVHKKKAFKELMIPL